MWLLETETKQRLEHAHESGIIPSAEQQIQFEARIGGGGEGGAPRILSIAGSTAEIAISGVLTQKPDFMAYYFGGGNTTYPDIVSAISLAESDDSINNIVYAIDSPGGNVDGLFDAIAAMNSAEKPSKTIIGGQAASAAYAMAVQADEVEALHKSSMIGSVGTLTKIRLDDSVVTLTSTKAPNKAPDVTTKEGKAAITALLDSMHDLFVDTIAEGRGTTAENINKNFGQGGVYLAEEATKRGMIDGIAGQTVVTKVPAKPKKTADAGGNTTEAKNMDRNELMTQHPELFSAVMAEGQTAERDRVVAHLTMGESSGDTATAFTAIKEGTAMTATLQATYMAAGMNKATVEARLADDADTDLGKLPAKVVTEADAGKVIMAKAAESCGVTLEA